MIVNKLHILRTNFFFFNTTREREHTKKGGKKFKLLVHIQTEQ